MDIKTIQDLTGFQWLDIHCNIVKDSFDNIIDIRNNNNISSNNETDINNNNFIFNNLNNITDIYNSCNPQIFLICSKKSSNINNNNIMEDSKVKTLNVCLLGEWFNAKVVMFFPNKNVS